MVGHEVHQSEEKLNKLSSELGFIDTSLLYNKKVWAVGGGKGGVGKSMVTANTAIALAQMGFRVIAIDLDLGGANLHTCLGLKIPEKTLSDYLSRKVTQFSELVIPTEHPNLSIISGAQDELGIANLKHLQKNKLLSSINSLDADYILMDLGAGTSFNTLDFFITASRGVLVVLPEPTSIENTYRFIKSAYFRQLKMIDDLYEIHPLINKAMAAKVGMKQSIPSEIISMVEEMNPELGARVRKELNRLKLNIIMNQVRSAQDIEIGHSIQSVCKKYFGISVEYAGHLEYDQVAWQSVKKRRPVLLEFPSSSLSNQFKEVVTKLQQSPN